MQPRLRSILPLFLLALPFALSAEEVDLNVIHQIKDQAFNHSKVMDYLNDIADENGPRVSGSPGFQRAAEKAVEDFRAAGIEQAGLERWGTFGRGWSWTRIAVQMRLPHETTLIAIPADWSAATDGPVSGAVVFAPLWERGEEPQTGDLVKWAEHIEQWKDRYRGTLEGKVVMLDQPIDFQLPDKLETFRFSAEDLAEMSKALEPGRKPPLEWPLVRAPVDQDVKKRVWDDLPLEVQADRWLLDLKLNNRVLAFLRDEGARAVLKTSRAPGAAVIRESNYGSWRDGDPIPPPTAVLMAEQYNRIYRLLQRSIPVEVSVDVDAQFHGPGVDGLNVVAELPARGRDPELVMLGAHLDSWHLATGATDNASGSAVVMEVMRILKALDLDMKRTVRAALWSGEEQCLCGSRGYVAQHFGDPVTMKLKPAHRKLSAYFNLDNGSGRIRGVYLQGNDMARPIFEAWLAPFADLGVTGGATITNTDGTDHLSFHDVGLPGFQFVQDPLDYELNTHHTNVDDVSHVREGDLMQAAAVMATAVYHAAVRDGMMPRPPLPAPLPPKQPLPEILRGD
jgi:carboxypeptidase Q